MGLAAREADDGGERGGHGEETPPKLLGIGVVVGK